MAEPRENGHPDRPPSVPLHLAATGPVVLVPLPDGDRLRACRVVCGGAVGAGRDAEVADARELLLAVGLIAAMDSKDDA